MNTLFSHGIPYSQANSMVIACIFNFKASSTVTLQVDKIAFLLQYMVRHIERICRVVNADSI